MIAIWSKPMEGTSASDTSSFILDGIGEDVPPEHSNLLVLHSLLPVAKYLGGLTQEKNSGYYYIQGDIQPSDQEALYNYTRRIGQLTLDSDSNLLHVLARIGQLQDPNKPLFPFLHHLRIPQPSLSLIFLHILLSPALTTVELTAIPVADPCYAAVLSFLECAVSRAPNLSTLILGPGMISDQVLDRSLRCQNLRCLELKDVKISITSQLLHDIGSLQHLETFVLLDNGTSTYTSALQLALTSIFTFSTPAGCYLDPNLNADKNAALFPALQTLKLDGPFNLIEDVVAKVSSSHLSALSIDVTKPLERMRSGVVLFNSPKHISTSDIMTFLTSSIQKWHKSLVSVSLTNNSTEILSFPSAVFEDFLLHPDTERLEISGMDITSMDHILHRLKEVSNSALEFLLLPVHRSTPSIPLAELRHIAKACPHLQSLRCPFRNLSEVKALNPLSHQLKELSVNNAEGRIGPVLEIAHYLDSIFPNIGSIKTHGSVEQCQHWRSISDLVKLCQAVRMEERRRLQEKS